MPFWKIAWRNMEQRGLASALTAFSMALGVAVMIAVIVIYSVAVRQFEQNAQGYHLIVGGKGGALQLVLSTVYYIGQPLYPIPYTYYQKFQPGGEFANVTAVAIPQCLGDGYKSPNGTVFRVVATTPDLFDKIEYGREKNGKPLKYEFQSGGRNLRDASQLHGEAFHEAAFEAVIGSVVAAQSGLKLGDEIQPTHGLGSDGHQHEGFKIVGILKPTGTANDRAVFINIEGFYRLEGHALADEVERKEGETHAAAHAHEAEHEHDAEHKVGEQHAADEHKDVAGGEAKHVDDAKHADEEKHDEHAGEEHKDGATADTEHHEEHDEHDAHAGHEHHGHIDEPLPIDQREVTSILVLCKTELGPLALDMAVNKGQDRIAQAVPPAREVSILLNSIVGPIRVVLLVLTVLVVIVAGISILVSIYNSMAERSHDIAVMRALGASRNAVMGIVLMESILLSVGGGLIGVLLGHGLLGVASPYVIERTGVVLSSFAFDWQELVLIPGLVVLASLVGFLPALAAYRTDVAKSLAGSR
ncbi:MAG: FtsX-like permease family protein [Pirellulales bacterium]